MMDYPNLYFYPVAFNYYNKGQNIVDEKANDYNEEDLQSKSGSYAACTLKVLTHYNESCKQK